MATQDGYDCYIIIGGKEVKSMSSIAWDEIGRINYITKEVKKYFSIIKYRITKMF
jgi:hypothetical protein